MSSKKKPETEPYVPSVMLGATAEEVAKQRAAGAFYEPMVVRSRNPGAEKKAAAVERNPKAKHDQETYEKRMDGFGDAAYDPFGLTDPFEQLKRDHERDGFALKLLSPDVMNRIGQRGYQMVKDENGEVVKCGKMVLGEIPERLAQQRRQAVCRRSQEELSTITDAHREKMQRLKTDAGEMGLTVLEAGDNIKNVGDNQTYDLGIRVDRGA